MAKEILDPEIEEEKHIKTVLDHDIKFSGNVKFSTSLKIKGEFNGEINSTGTLYTGRNAVVKAKIKTKNITVYGKIDGNVESFEKIELLSKAELTGDIKASDLFIESGCTFNGKCIMTRPGPLKSQQDSDQDSVKKEVEDKEKK